MTEQNFSKIACAALNAAQQVIYDAGIRDLVIHQLGFAKADDIKAGKKNLISEAVYECSCYDCTGGGGPCACYGPPC